MGSVIVSTPDVRAIDATPNRLRVEVRAARIPVVGLLAHHHWFVVDVDGRRDRWEVWQRPDVGGECSWGHLHKNLKPADDGVGWGPSFAVAVFEGEDARRLRRRIERSPEDYPFCQAYRYWPGPNSNTYVQWLLAELELPAWAIGKRYALRLRERLPVG